MESEQSIQYIWFAKQALSNIRKHFWLVNEIKIQTIINELQ